MAGLAEKDCAACRGDMPVLTPTDVERLLPQVSRWTVEGGHHVARSFTFPDFADALAFVNRVGAVAEDQGHHPEIRLGWGHVDIEIWTHKVDGLTESDFVLAAKIDALLRD